MSQEKGYIKMSRHNLGAKVLSPSTRAIRWTWELGKHGTKPCQGEGADEAGKQVLSNVLNVMNYAIQTSFVK
jgi:hypothetical protein